jgi:hypothetical protein
LKLQDAINLSIFVPQIVGQQASLRVASTRMVGLPNGGI